VFAYTVLSAGIFSSEKGKEAIHAGLQQARGSMELVGSVKATSVAATELDDLDTVGTWTPSSNVTVATDASDRKEGSSSADLTIDAGFTTGLAAYSATLTVDLSAHYSARLWIKSSTPTADGDLQLVIDDSGACGTPLETLDIPALTANVWVQTVLKLSDPSLLSTVQCVGITGAVDVGATVVTIDLIEAPTEVTELSFLVANALAGEPINLTTTTDVNDDGLLSDETTKTHVLSAIYSDSEQRTTDVTWSKTELGKGDGDALLETGEKMKITVETHAADPMPVADTTFTLTIVRDQGAELVIERTLPSVLTTEMDLN
jgi:archaellin